MEDQTRAIHNSQTTVKMEDQTRAIHNSPNHKYKSELLFMSLLALG